MKIDQYLTCLVGLPGIEPGPHPPHGCILPLYDSPFYGLIVSYFDLFKPISSRASDSAEIQEEVACHIEAERSPLRGTWRQ